MDGKNFKITGDVLSEYFHKDKYGSYIPDPAKLRVEDMAKRVSKQLNANTGLFERLAKMFERTDVITSNRPLGNTVAIGAGIKYVGQPPYKPISFGEAMAGEGIGQSVVRKLEKREAAIEALQLELMDLLKSLEPDKADKANHLVWRHEQDQVMTGGGFDNNKVGEVHKNSLEFLTGNDVRGKYANSVLSELVVEACGWLRDHINKDGLAYDSLTPVGASASRMAQDNDGLVGWPVYAKGLDPLTQELAKRLMIETGVDVSHLVGKMIVDPTTGAEVTYRVIDAGGFILENKGVWTSEDFANIMIQLIRIQKHGWKMVDGKLTAKDGKTRGVQSIAFLPGLIEAMVITPLIKALQEHEVSFIPSLLTKSKRVDIIKRLMTLAHEMDYMFLSADCSGFDKRVLGEILATLIQLVFKPFFKSQYHSWIDLVTYIVTYKYFMLNTDLANLWPDLFTKAKEMCPNTRVKQYTIFGLLDGLGSGLKMTHVAGSAYGMITIHYTVPKLLNYKPFYGVQGGDDVLMGVPKSAIVPTSAESTYGPLSKAALEVNVVFNVAKQIWIVEDDEPLNVFLQDNYHLSTGVWGVGSAFRPASAVFYAEHNRGLSLAEQLMAQIARMNQGADNFLIGPVVEWWLSKERYLGWLFKEYGKKGFEVLIETLKVPLSEVAKRIDVGSFSFGVEKDDLEAGTLPILPVMVNVTNQMTFSSEDKIPIAISPNPDDMDKSIVDVDDESLPDVK